MDLTEPPLSKFVRSHHK